MSSFPEQLQEYALSEITRRIQTGEYPVGSRLVAKTIADSLNISATPVVAAINRLAAQGLVETIPRKGAVVKTFSTTDIGNYFEARTMIECFVAHLAVQNVDKFPESVKKMQEAADQLERVHVEQMDVEQIRKLFLCQMLFFSKFFDESSGFCIVHLVPPHLNPNYIISAEKCTKP